MTISEPTGLCELLLVKLGCFGLASALQLTKFCCDSQSQCQELRKRKQLELQILSESIQRWEGEDIKMMGNVIYMSQVMVQSGGSEVSVVFLLLAVDFMSEYPLAPGVSDVRW